MKYFALCICLALSTLQAQNNYNSESFKVTRADIESTGFINDSTANALVIYEVGDSYVDNSSYRLNTTIKRKLKILNRNGFEHGTVAIYLYNNNNGRKEKIEDINATVYNIVNEKVVKTTLEKSSIFEEHYNENYTIVKFALPNLKIGSVITYSYTVETPFMHKYKSWYFQDKIPKLHSEYNASIPGNWEYNIKLVGANKLATKYSTIEKNCLQISNGANSSCGIYKYIMKDIPAFINEDFMTTQLNYLSRIEYELKVFRGFDGTIENITKTWKTTDKEIEKDTDLGKQLRRTGIVKKLLKDSITTETDELTKAKKILKYMQKEYTWNKNLNVLQNVSIKDLITEKSGNVGEINALLYNLLITNNIDAKPILLSTRRNGFITRLYPVISDFNYLIIKVNIQGETYLLDATDDYLTFGQIPFRCLNSYGRLLDFDSKSEWYSIHIKDYSAKIFRYNLDFDETKTLKGKVNYSSKGYHSLYDRERYFSNIETYKNDYINKYSTIAFSNFNTKDTHKTSEDFNLDFQIEHAPDEVGNTIYINPYVFKFFDKNPFQLQERSYPIDFGYKDTYTYGIQINIDNTFDIKSIPEPTSLALPNNKGSFICSVKQEEHTITIYFKLTFKEAIYEPIYYDGLKKLLEEVINTQNNSLIVVEKKQ
ncbi:DUF3857 domain-containing protein [Psychroserpens damuponensis]|uniref:DUF3857 domain-containing protein n=1 Tax=Psychroserpens damuponensis TaxID=943936 RepID=UPI00058BA35C|nr:DUF3857 domain-containing protein [Psychroserpens damuponensis]